GEVIYCNSQVIRLDNRKVFFGTFQVIFSWDRIKENKITTGILVKHRSAPKDCDFVEALPKAPFETSFT
ncbi:hypothetical protein NPN18_25140, partial [Vibrio parahaemolyticus]|nr:hypothetical protein [Vibrio parahaemolyticus]